MSVEHNCSCGQSNATRGKITVTWRAAITNALVSWKDFAIKSIVLASIASVIRMLQGFAFQGFALWFILASLMFAVHVSENARLQRKESRYEYPSTLSTEKDDN